MGFTKNTGITREYEVLTPEEHARIQAHLVKAGKTKESQSARVKSTGETVLHSDKQG